MLAAWHNGQGDEPAGYFEEHWLLMSTEGVLAAKPDLDAAAVGNGKGTGWRPEWIPFLDDDSGDYLCVDTSQAVAPVAAFWLGKEEHPVVVPSLTAWVQDFVTAALAGRYHEDPERGTFLAAPRRTSCQLVPTLPDKLAACPTREGGAPPAAG